VTVTIGRMSTLKANVVANLAGSVWSALLTIAVLPIYFRLLGAGLYGLVGLNATLQMLFLFLDLGLGTALNREMARLTLDDQGPVRARTLLKTLDLVYWVGAVLIFVTVLFTARVIAYQWLKPVQIRPDVAAHAIVAMGLILALQFPYGLYSGALLGLQRQVQLNAWQTIGTSLRLLLPIPVLLAYGPDITLFFASQAFAMALQTIGARILAGRAIPKTRERPRVDFAELRRVRGFAARVTAVTILGVIVLQLDKVLMSRFASLQELGYYSVAATAAAGLAVISLPVYVATFPRFSQLVAAGRREDVDLLYHRATQFVAALLLPMAAIIGVFSRELLLIWTGNPTVVEHGARPLSLLAIAASASSLGYVAQALQLAEGWTRFAASLNGIGVIVLIPAMSVAAMRYGGVGVSLMSATWNVLAFCVTATLIHRRLLKGGGLEWFLRDIAPPLMASLTLALVGHYVCAGLHGSHAAAGIALTALLTLLASVSVVPVTWQWLRQVRSPVS
jgi:Membrane protein involved in the export of O-antigen and teichoic acid